MVRFIYLCVVWFWILQFFFISRLGILVRFLSFIGIIVIFVRNKIMFVVAIFAAL